MTQRRTTPLPSWSYVASQWKVRRTLAFSVHELAKIVNSEAILNDLLPAFDSFTKDVDEVNVFFVWLSCGEYGVFAL